MNARPEIRPAAPLLSSGFRFKYAPAVILDLIRFADLACLALGGLATAFVLEGPATAEPEYTLFTIVFFGFVYINVASQANLYAMKTLTRFAGRLDDILLSIVVALLLFLSVLVSLKVTDNFDLRWVLAFAVAAFAAIATGRFLICVALRRMARARMIGRSLVVLGAGEQARRFLRRFAAVRPFFTAVVGVFDHTAEDPCPGGAIEGAPIVGGLESLLAAARAGKVDDIVVAMPWNADRQVTETIEKLKELPINVYLSSDLVGFELAFRPASGALNDLPLFEVVERPISGWSWALKTLEDYVLATLAVIAISPLLIVIAIAIKLDTPGPVLFRQMRLGFNNQPFAIYKFRSMHHREQPEQVVQQAAKGDPRVTRVGRIIRATSLDELPQLFNVLNGTMSLVGPRPHALSHNAEYSRQIRGYFARHKVKPGITGWAQVNGLRGETETLEKMEARIRHDVYYAENWSLFFDIRILIQTALVVPFQKSAY